MSDKYYNSEKGIKRDKFFFSKKALFTEGVIDTNKIFFEKVERELKGKSKASILDIGTGTGYVPRVLTQFLGPEVKIIGIDNSKEMIKIAADSTPDKNVEYIEADNFKLPFGPNKFDVVTNKLATNFSIAEVYRVLKKNGIFVFKEYGQNKGFREVREIFGNRFKKAVNPTSYYEELLQAGFTEVTLRSFRIKRSYTQGELSDIFGMANIIKGFNDSDMATIRKALFSGRKKAVVESDPFIIWARK